MALVYIGRWGVVLHFQYCIYVQAIYVDTTQKESKYNLYGEWQSQKVLGRC